MKIKILLIITFSLQSLLFAEISEKSLEAANELAESIGMKNQFKAGFDAMLPMIDEQAKQMDLSDNEKVELRKIYQDWFEEDIDHEKVTKEVIELYATTFSAKELKELSAFYKTDLGQKALRVLPVLLQEGAKLGMEEGQRKQGKLIERLQPFMEKRTKQ